MALCWKRKGVRFEQARCSFPKSPPGGVCLQLRNIGMAVASGTVFSSNPREQPGLARPPARRLRSGKRWEALGNVLITSWPASPLPRGIHCWQLNKQLSSALGSLSLALAAGTWRAPLEALSAVGMCRKQCLLQINAFVVPTVGQLPPRYSSEKEGGSKIRYL